MTNYDGTQDFASTGSVTNSQLSTTVVWKGTALPVGAANEVPQNGIFILLDSMSTPTSQTWYIQTSATLSSPSFVEIPEKGGQDGDMLEALNTTIGSYSSASADAIVSSGGTISSEGTASFSQETGGNTVEISSFYISRAAERVINTSSALYNQFVTKIELWIGKSGSPTGTATIGVWNSAGSLQFTFGTQDVSALGGETWMSYENLTGYTLQSGDYIGIQYTGGNSVDYVSSKYTVSDAFDGGNSIYYEDTTSFSPSDFRFRIYKGVQKTTALDDNNTGTTWTSDSENTPYALLDLGAVRDLKAVAINLNRTTTTETEIEIISVDDLDLTNPIVLRTLSVSDFTDDTTRFIMIPRMNSDKQYIQIKGKSNSVVLSLNEFWYKTGTYRRHYHKYIDPSSTSSNTEDSN